MTGKSFLTGTLALPLALIVGAAYAGPTTSYPPARSSITTSGSYAQYVPTKRADGAEYRYSGGPKSPIWVQRRQ
jgi:hypothetical protein